jgi:hypothetical protein
VLLRLTKLCKGYVPVSCWQQHVQFIGEDQAHQELYSVPSQAELCLQGCIIRAQTGVMLTPFLVGLATMDVAASLQRELQARWRGTSMLSCVYVAFLERTTTPRILQLRTELPSHFFNDTAPILCLCLLLLIMEELLLAERDSHGSRM